MDSTGTASILILVGALMVVIPEPATSTLGLFLLAAGVILYFYQ